MTKEQAELKAKIVEAVADETSFSASVRALLAAADIRERKRKLDEEQLRMTLAKASDDGFTAKGCGEKLKTNPHEAGTKVWWAWHDGYKKRESHERRALPKATKGTGGRT